MKQIVEASIEINLSGCARFLRDLINLPSAVSKSLRIIQFQVVPMDKSYYVIVLCEVAD